MIPKGPRTLALAALTVMAISSRAGAADFYVSPTAGANGNGSIGNPWRLQTALDHPAAVDPGDTIWLRGGTYVGHFTANLAGTAADPIIVRQYPGERATIDGNYGGNAYTFDIHGAYTWYWGFEVTNSDPGRWSSDPSDPPARRGNGVILYGDGCRLINMVIHDTAQGVLNSSAANATEIYGSLIYYNGYDASDRGHGHGIYIANDAGNAPKKVTDNVIFEQFSYGIHGYTEGGDLDNLEYQGNTVFDNGGLSSHGWSTNILLGGLKAAANPKLISNATYNQDHAGSNNLGYSAGCSNATVWDNYFDNDTALKVVNCPGISMTGNTFYDSVVGFSQSQYPGNTYLSVRPSGPKVFIRPNAYETGRAHVTVYNWDLASTVPVNLSSVLAPGAAFALRNAQNPFGPAVLSGIYAGGSLNVPMTGLTAANPVGVAAPPAAGPEFAVFILTSTLAPYEFFDVPQVHMFHDAIHTLAANGITAGCGDGNFCPNDPVTRAQMAVFLLKAEHGPGYVPPAATGNVFDDVAAGDFAAAWIEQLEAEGISSGCGGGDFCPGAAVTRAQMAVFLLKALLGSGYAPPAATGSVFSDVPAHAFAAAWIEELADRGISAGCGSGKFCPSSINTRGQMAVFLVSTFSLQ